MSAVDKRVALVTGAGHGIGRGIALRLAQDGFIVVVNYINADLEDVGKTNGFSYRFQVDF